MVPKTNVYIHLISVLILCQTISVTNKKKHAVNKDSQFRREVCIFCQIEHCASQHHPRNENKKQLVKHETSRTLCHNEFSSSTLNLEDAIRDSWNFEVSSPRLVNF